jgi:hypothetical protein
LKRGNRNLARDVALTHLEGLANLPWSLGYGLDSGDFYEQLLKQEKASGGVSRINRTRPTAILRGDQNSSPPPGMWWVL